MLKVGYSYNKKTFYKEKNKLILFVSSHGHTYLCAELYHLKTNRIRNDQILVSDVHIT